MESTTAPTKTRRWHDWPAVSDGTWHLARPGVDYDDAGTFRNSLTMHAHRNRLSLQSKLTDEGVKFCLTPPR